MVYAPELSERAILDAIRAGRVFIDVRGSRDALLELTADGPSGHAMVGDALAAPAGASVRLSVHVAHVKGGHITMQMDGAPMPMPNAEIASDDEVKTLQVVADGKRHWVTADVATDGLPALIGNPIYLTP